MESSPPPLMGGLTSFLSSQGVSRQGLVLRVVKKKSRGFIVRGGGGRSREWT